MEAKVYTEIRALFTEYLTEKKLRKTEERYAIFKEICAFPGHFDMCMLSDRLEQDNFHVSKADERTSSGNNAPRSLNKESP